MKESTCIVRAASFPLFEIRLDVGLSWVCARAAARAIEVHSSNKILTGRAKDADESIRQTTTEEREEIDRLVEIAASE